jgi:hypothetical protein
VKADNGVSAHECNAITDDFYIPGGTMERNQAWLDVGFTPEKCIEAYQDTINATVAAFPETFVRSPIGFVAPAICPAGDTYISEQVMDWAKRVHPEKVIFQRHAIVAGIPEPGVDADMGIHQLLLDNQPWSAGQHKEAANLVSGIGNTGGYISYDPNEVLTEGFRKARLYGLSYLEVYAKDFTVPESEQAIVYGADLLTISTAPADLHASTLRDTDITLSWTQSYDKVGVAGYQVYRDGTFVATTAALAYPIVGLQPETRYRFHVVAYDAQQNRSDASNTLTVTTPSRPPPSPPENLRLIP